MNILNLLANDGFICVNKQLIKLLGLEATVFLGELASIYNYNKNLNTLKDGWFFATVEKIENNTSISDYKQQQIIKKLQKLNIIKHKIEGMPRKRYFMLNENIIWSILQEQALPPVSENSEDSILILGQQYPNFRTTVSENSDDYIYNNTLNNNTYDNTPQQEGDSNQKSNKQILENNQKSKPITRISAPAVSAGSQLPKKVKAKLLQYHGQAKTALGNYCLFLMDSYDFKDTALGHRVDDVMRKARGTDAGIEIICNFNIDRNYRVLYLPSNLSKQIVEDVVISEQATENDFVRDADGNIEEDW